MQKKLVKRKKFESINIRVIENGFMVSVTTNSKKEGWIDKETYCKDAAAVVALITKETK